MPDSESGDYDYCASHQVNKRIMKHSDNYRINQYSNRKEDSCSSYIVPSLEEHNSERIKNNKPELRNSESPNSSSIRQSLNSRGISNSNRNFDNQYKYRQQGNNNNNKMGSYSSTGQGNVIEETDAFTSNVINNKQNKKNLSNQRRVFDAEEIYIENDGSYAAKETALSSRSFECNKMGSQQSDHNFHNSNTREVPNSSRHFRNNSTREVPNTSRSLDNEPKYYQQGNHKDKQSNYSSPGWWNETKETDACTSTVINNKQDKKNSSNQPGFFDGKEIYVENDGSYATKETDLSPRSFECNNIGLQKSDHNFHNSNTREMPNSSRNFRNNSTREVPNSRRSRDDEPKCYQQENHNNKQYNYSSYGQENIIEETDACTSTVINKKLDKKNLSNQRRVFDEEEIYVENDGSYAAKETALSSRSFECNKMGSQKLDHNFHNSNTREMPNSSRNFRYNSTREVPNSRRSRDDEPKCYQQRNNNNKPINYSSYGQENIIEETDACTSSVINNKQNKKNSSNQPRCFDAEEIENDGSYDVKDTGLSSRSFECNKMGSQKSDHTFHNSNTREMPNSSRNFRNNSTREVPNSRRSRDDERKYSQQGNNNNKPINYSSYGQENIIEETDAYTSSVINNKQNKKNSSNQRRSFDAEEIENDGSYAVKETGLSSRSFEYNKMELQKSDHNYHNINTREMPNSSRNFRNNSTRDVPNSRRSRDDEPKCYQQRNNNNKPINYSSYGQENIIEETDACTSSVINNKQNKKNSSNQPRCFDAEEIENDGSYDVKDTGLSSRSFECNKMGSQKSDHNFHNSNIREMPNSSRNFRNNSTREVPNSRRSRDDERKCYQQGNNNNNKPINYSSYGQENIIEETDAYTSSVINNKQNKKNSSNQRRCFDAEEIENDGSYAVKETDLSSRSFEYNEMKSQKSAHNFRDDINTEDMPNSDSEYPDSTIQSLSRDRSNIQNNSTRDISNKNNRNVDDHHCQQLNNNKRKKEMDVIEETDECRINVVNESQNVLDNRESVDKEQIFVDRNSLLIDSSMSDRILEDNVNMTSACDEFLSDNTEHCDTEKINDYVREGSRYKYKKQSVEGNDSNDVKQEPAVTYRPPDIMELSINEFLTTGENVDYYNQISIEVLGNNPFDPISSLEDVDLNTGLRNNISELYTKLTPIQKYGIPNILQGRDVMACSETGSGKTAAYVIPVLGRLLQFDIIRRDRTHPVAPFVLMLAPTRELVIQIATICYAFARGTDIKVQHIYGGTAGYVQKKRIKGAHVLVSTVGRLLDYLEEGYITFHSLRFIVFDEADRMLDMGFRPEIEQIVKHQSMTNKAKKQILMFSATYSNEIQELAEEYLTDYLFICAGSIGSAAKQIEQTILEVPKLAKRQTVVELLKREENKTGILIFVQTKRLADDLTEYLLEKNVSVISMHGDRSQKEREESLSCFKKGEVNVLVATSVAARGLDIKGVNHVINYDLPEDIVDYIHRIGRTGRLGNYGMATSFYDECVDNRIANDLIKVLTQSDQYVPEWLKVKPPPEATEEGEKYNYLYLNPNVTDAKKVTAVRAMSITCETSTYKKAEEYFHKDWL